MLNFLIWAWHNVLMVLTSLFLICLVLIQRGKGGGLAGAFGGMGGSSAFGTKAGDVFTRVTIYTALLWFFLALFLVYTSNSQARQSDFHEGTAERGNLVGEIGWCQGPWHDPSSQGHWRHRDPARHSGNRQREARHRGSRPQAFERRHSDAVPSPLPGLGGTKTPASSQSTRHRRRKSMKP